MKIREMLDKKLKEKQRKQRAKTTKKVVIGAVAGIVSGVAGGILLAPKAGKEVREDIAKTAKDLSETAIAKSVEIKETLDDKVVKTKNNANIAKEKISKYLSDKKAEKNNKNEAEAVVEEEKETATKSKE